MVYKPTNISGGPHLVRLLVDTVVASDHVQSYFWGSLNENISQESYHAIKKNRTIMAVRPFLYRDFTMGGITNTVNGIFHFAGDTTCQLSYFLLNVTF